MSMQFTRVMASYRNVMILLELVPKTVLSLLDQVLMLYI